MDEKKTKWEENRESGLPTMRLLRTGLRKHTHGEAAHNAGCRCALYVLKCPVSEVKAHLNGIRSQQLATH